MFDQQGRRKYLNSAERLAYAEALESEPDEARRAFGLTLFHTGCRISEALNLTAPGIDLSQKCVVFETLKQRQRGIYRAVPIPDSLVLLLGKLLAGLDPASPVWPFPRSTAYRMVKRWMFTMGLTGAMMCPKGLRHGFAVACIAHSIPLPTVQRWLGHARLETTSIYLGVSGDEERNLAQRLWQSPKIS